MKLNKRKVGLLILLTTIALIGLIGIQVYLLANAMQQKQQAFKQNVNTALKNIVQKLETREAVSTYLNVSVDVDEVAGSDISLFHFDAKDSLKGRKAPRLSKPYLNMAPQIDFDSSRVTFILIQPQHVRIRIVDSLGQVLDKIVDEYRPAGRHIVQLDTSKFNQGDVQLNFSTDSTSYWMKIQTDKTYHSKPKFNSNKQRRILVNRIVREMSGLKKRPIEERIRQSVLDSLVAATLRASAIETPYAYGVVVAANQDSVIMANKPEFREQLRESQFKSTLFPNDVFVENNALTFYFPQQRFYVFKQISTLVVISCVFILVIVVCFIYIIDTLFKQKEFATRLTNFINNMTHEFKTPISTIALANETLSKPVILKDEKRLQQYNRIIQDENNRMRMQVDKILQMAILEEGDFQLSCTHLNVHELLAKVIENHSLQIEKKGGKINSNFQAENAVVQADALHLSNVIHNILDNACKYTRKTPEIWVTTTNENQSLKMLIRDNGMGIPPEEQKHIFDKYYRVPTGNVHDVKGFGLGLSYVKLMMEAHKGSISVKSEVHKGTTLELILPSVANEKKQKNHE